MNDTPPDCDRCGNPTVWSLDHERRWCSVYGDHRVDPARWHPAVLAVLDRDMQWVA